MENLDVEMAALDGIDGMMEDRIIKKLEAPISGVPTPQSVVPENNAEHPRGGEMELMEDPEKEGYEISELEEAYSPNMGM